MTLTPETRDHLIAYATVKNLTTSEAAEELILAGLERRQAQSNGGKATSAARTPQERSEAARRAVLARYADRRPVGT